MEKRRLRLAAVFVVVIVAVSAVRAAADEARAVRRVVDEIIAADNRGDLDAAMALYAEDAILLPPGEPAVEGRATISRRYHDIFAGTDLALDDQIDSVRIADGWAVVRGRITGAARSKTDGAGRTVDDKFMMLLEKKAGRWLITELMWSSSSGK